ncbi:MAG: hypothetical protein HWN65_08280 [Candidatus Helarchaeota archaeon]|nr:hypothetical protein [Candidatus Helarchaeota archaeon]
MTLEKCILKLAMASKLCDNLISKELLVLSCLINEPGLRVSDIHTVLGGNKSWVSNLCSRLAISGLASSVKEGREVYYSLTEKGEDVAINAFGLINSLVKTDGIPYLLSDNTYILHKTPELEKKNEIRKITSPIYTHKGALLYNNEEKYLLFIGKSPKNKFLVLKVPLNIIKSVEQRFDDYYKRRKAPRPTPLRIKYQKSADEELQTLYAFTNFRIIGRLTQNSEWHTLLNKELTQIQKRSDESNTLETNNNVAPLIEGKGE